MKQLRTLLSLAAFVLFLGAVLPSAVRADDQSIVTTTPPPTATPTPTPTASATVITYTASPEALPEAGDGSALLMVLLLVAGASAAMYFMLPARSK